MGGNVSWGGGGGVRGRRGEGGEGLVCVIIHPLWDIIRHRIALFMHGDINDCSP